MKLENQTKTSYKIKINQNDLPSQDQLSVSSLSMEGSNLNVQFLCMVFMNKDLLVTGGSNGFLYIFKKGILIEEQIGHLKSPILCIDKSEAYENFFVSGGKDGSVNLWEIRNYQDSNVIEKLFEYNIYDNFSNIEMNNSNSKEE